MRSVVKIVLTVVVAGIMTAPQAMATVSDSDVDLDAQVYVQTGRPVLAPMAFVRFCLAYRHDCNPVHASSPDEYRPTENRIAQLKTVNLRVNRAIHYRYAFRDVLDERWRISPTNGACADYAVTKRHELMLLGWPPRALLLAEVVIDNGEHHLVLVARTSMGDLVLDSRTSVVQTATRTGYRWVRIQSSTNPLIWHSADRSFG